MMIQYYLCPSDMLCALSKMQDDENNTCEDQSPDSTMDNEVEELLEQYSAEKTDISSSEHNSEKSHQQRSDLTLGLLQHDDLKIYHLTERDIQVLAPLWNAYLEEGNSISSSSEIMKSIGSADIDTRDKIAWLISLLDRNILNLNSRQVGDYHRNIRVLLEGIYEFDSMFINVVLGNTLIEKACRKYKETCISPNGIVSSAMKLLDDVFSAYRESWESPNIVCGYRYGNILDAVYQTIISSFGDLKSDAELFLIKQEYQLCPSEILVLLILLYFTESGKEDISSTKLIALLAKDEADEAQWQHVICPQSKLMTTHIIKKDQYLLFDNRELRLSKNICERLQIDASESRGEALDWKILVENSESFSLVKTKQTIEQLYLPQNLKDIIRTVVEKIKHPEKYDLSQWGLMSESLSNSVNNGSVILLYGLPGTGKTFAAGAIANSLNRDLVSINASELKSHFYGDSQQLVKACFQEMRKIVATSDTPPIFLLNEADQLIHTRLDLNQSCASTENAIQNIILEELETFPGILIATTNLMENIDPAFFRRFHYKIELPFPDAECRSQIWRLHLPSTIPGASSIDIAALSKAYPLTGGQIKIIVANACSYAMQKEEPHRYISQSDLELFVEMEDSGMVQCSGIRVGFEV